MPALTKHGVFKHTVHEAALNSWGAEEGAGKENLTYAGMIISSTENTRGLKWKKSESNEISVF